MKAREAFAKTAGIAMARDVEEMPGLRAVLVRLEPGEEWQTVLTAATQNQFFVFHAYHWDDLAANFARVRAAEQAIAATARAQRRGAWQWLAAGDPRLYSGRVLAQALLDLTATRARAWDPRLDELLALAESGRETWRVLVPELSDPVIDRAAAPDGPGETIAARVQRERDRQLTLPEGQLLGQWRQPVSAQAEALLVSQCLTAARIARVCTTVAAHADKIAVGARDEARAGHYRALAAACRDLAAAGAAAARYTAF